MASEFNELATKLKSDWDNREIAFEALHSYSIILKYASPSIKDDKEFLMKVIAARVKPKYGRNTEGFLLQNASDRLKDDYDFVLACVSVDGDVLIDASERLRDNEQIAFAAIQNDTKALRDDREIALVAVSHSGSNLTLASERLQGDILVVLIALNGTFPHTIYWRADDWDGEYPKNLFKSVSDSLKKDSFFALLIVEAFMKTPYGEKYSMEELKKDPCNIFNILDTICREYVLFEGEKPPFGLDLNSAIELVKRKNKE